jgi:flagella basal body P-ring formation protein FlgA
MALILLALGTVLGDEVRLAPETTVPIAIERAVIDRLGDVEVVVREVSTTVVDQSGLVATIEPGSRLGQPIRFILLAHGKRVGSAVARLEVVGRAPRARRAFARDEEISAADIDVARVEIKNAMLRRLPELNDVAGSRARRDIVAGELLTNALVVVPPAVRSGDEVRVTVTMGAVQVSGVGRASGSGQVGDTVRVSTPSSRRLLSARIIGRGAVEISR